MLRLRLIDLFNDENSSLLAFASSCNFTNVLKEGFKISRLRVEKEENL